MADSVWRPVYEWRWRTFKTRSPSKAAMLKRAAAKHGEEVERIKVGLCMKAATTRKLNEIVAGMMAGDGQSWMETKTAQHGKEHLRRPDSAFCSQEFAAAAPLMLVCLRPPGHDGAHAASEDA